jgi:hypothetical protein
MPGAPAAACVVVENTRVSHRRLAGAIRHSLHDGLLSLFRALPGVPGLIASVACAFVTRKLDTSVGVSGPHGFAVRTAAPVSRRNRVHRIPLANVRDDRDTPL